VAFAAAASIQLGLSSVELGVRIRRIDHRHDLVLFYGVADIDQPLRNVGGTARTIGRDV
jgi:hypothetical protein